MVSDRTKHKVLAVMMAIEKLIEKLTPEEKEFLEVVKKTANEKGNAAAQDLFK